MTFCQQSEQSSQRKRETKYRLNCEFSSGMQVQTRRNMGSSSIFAFCGRSTRAAGEEWCPTVDQTSVGSAMALVLTAFADKEGRTC